MDAYDLRPANPCFFLKFPAPSSLIPCSKIRGYVIAPQESALLGIRDGKCSRESSEFPANFPASREFAVEKGSTPTAPTASR